MASLAFHASYALHAFLAFDVSNVFDKRYAFRAFQGHHYTCYAYIFSIESLNFTRLRDMYMTGVKLTRDKWRKEIGNSKVTKMILKFKRTTITLPPLFSLLSLES